MAVATRLEIHPIAGALGAEIHGVDLARDTDDATIAGIREALLEHCVVFFRDQTLNADQQKRLARRFGDLFVHPNYVGLQADPEIVEIRREPGDTRIVGEDWHTDTTMVADPPMGAILYAIEVPPYGGDTLFANQYLAYEALSDGMKRLLSTLRAVHSDRKVAGPKSGANVGRSTKARDDDTWRETVSVHPVVRTHPETNEKVLFVNAFTTHFVNFHTPANVRYGQDFAPGASDLLNYLIGRAAIPEYQVRWRWTPNSVAIWDNRCTQHYAVQDYWPAVRKMERAGIVGDPTY